MDENKLFFSNILYAQGVPKDAKWLQNFCGKIIYDFKELSTMSPADSKTIYLTGDLNNEIFVAFNCKIFIVEEYSKNYCKTLACSSSVTLISKGEIPLNYYNVGIFFPNFFTQQSLFEKIENEHEFQELTESTKDSIALRKGIYLTNIEKTSQGELAFHLLRCSTNLRGPTDNFRATDHLIIKKVNEMLPNFFEKPIQINHVLAQIYYNSKNEDTKTEKKATIKAHSDKTKDMPSDGVIAFATFYDHSSIKDKTHLSNKDEYDIVYKDRSSIFTQLEFVLKDPAANPNMKDKFRVTLYPNSLFVISLEMNRLYTHEIKPSHLHVDCLPTRMGYVMRCSIRKALYSQGKTFLLLENGERQPLQPMNSKDMKDIKDLYYRENIESDRVHYVSFFTSLNNGDYQEPIF